LYYSQFIAIYLSSPYVAPYQSERPKSTCFDRFNFWYL